MNFVCFCFLFKLGGFFWSLYRLFIAPKKPQNQDMLKFRLRMSLVEVSFFITFFLL